VFSTFWRFKNIFLRRFLHLLFQEDQLGVSLLTLEQLESEESQKKIETKIQQQWMAIPRV